MCGLQLLRVLQRTEARPQSGGYSLELNQLYPDDPEVCFTPARYMELCLPDDAKVGASCSYIGLAAPDPGRSAGKSRAYDAAISEYRQVLAADPRRPGIHYRIGRTLLARSLQTTSSEDLAKH